MDQLKLHPTYGVVSMVRSVWTANTVCTYEWIIRDFEKVLNGINSLQSPIFDDTNIECYMEVKKDIDFRGSTLISLELHSLFTNDVEATVTFHLFSEHAEKAFMTVSARKGRFSPTGLTFTASDVMEVNDLLCIIQGDSLRYLPRYSLTIQCEIKKTACDLQEIKTKLKELSDFENLFENDEHSDVVIVVEGKTFPAHKCILAARSSVFAAMFRHDMKENKENSVEINDITSEVMGELLRFMYKAGVGNINTIAFDLYRAADKYQLDGLKVICEEALGKNLNNTNIFDYLHIACNNSMRNLKNLAIGYIASHAEELKRK